MVQRALGWYTYRSPALIFSNVPVFLKVSDITLWSCFQAIITLQIFWFVTFQTNTQTNKQKNKETLFQRKNLFTSEPYFKGSCFAVWKLKQCITFKRKGDDNTDE